MLARQTGQGSQSGDTGSGGGAIDSRPWAASDGSAREARFQAQVSSFARRLAADAVRDQAKGIDDALDFLASGLGASAAAFYTYTAAPTAAASATSLPAGRAESAHFRLPRRQSWTGPSQADRIQGTRSGLPEELDLERLPEQGEALRAGEAIRIYWTQGSARLLSPTLGESMWKAIPRRTQALLLVPCVGPEGLLGLFAVEGGLASQCGNESVLSSVTLMGALFASWIDRSRLARQLEASRKTRAESDRLETLGRVAISVAHDFNNVLTAIGGNAELLEMTLADDAKGLEEVHEISEASARAAELVEEVLCFGRVREDSVRRVNLAELVSRLGPIMRRVAGNGMEVRVDLASDLPSVELDPGRFERVLLNLASNARDAQPENRPRAGVLTLSARTVRADPLISLRGSGSAPLELPNGEYLCLRVEDDGCGMDLQVQEKAFEPFFTTKGEGQGTGLGLATCAEIMREMGGAVSIDSAPGEGTAFDLYLPVAG